MDFFSKLGKKATETYKITKEKATTISEELKLKGKISEAKDNIEEIYIEIGKTVFQEIKAGKDVIREEITEKIDKISKLQEKIEQLESQILALKKIKKCDKCGIELDLDAEFCSKCGKKQPEPEKVEIKEEQVTEVKEADVLEIKNVENEQENIEEKKEEQ